MSHSPEPPLPRSSQSNLTSPPDFSDTAYAFAHLSSSALRTEILLFRMLSCPGLVAFGKWALHTAKALHLPVGWVLKPTIYSHFVGGEDLDDCLPLMNRLRERDLLSLLDYSAESGSGERETMRTYNENKASLKFAAEHRDLLSHAVVKAGGLIDVAILTKAAEYPEALSEKEKETLELFHDRFMALCREAYDLDVKIIIDAEHYAYQPIIDRYTEEAMCLFNKHKAIVFQTLQMYRKDRLDYLYALDRLSHEKEIYIGAKLVRGAYMEEERRRAARHHYPDPIHESKAATDEAYDKATAFVLDRLDHFELFVGTHNEASLGKVVAIIDQQGLERRDHRILLSQLLGMGDELSYNLSRAGCNVAKYVPYAPVKHAIPYLIRRAEENSGIRGQVSRELAVRRQELKRRRSEKKGQRSSDLPINLS